ncbi:sensor histidine kinase [Oceanirhabdus sp. W0125-5]|uniref:sensor histidine kinase n=1 Tax=Oceanirhabdus sp. W0125-5 TaxID=2999116 RepID=UPI0022F315C9|nr:sensor histidine kinase [Oceanirhabdus sp. W0125-5]WBW96868.1 sensor histidine kinase [Oceanirhabdus sp. W0125-5]
MRIFEYIKINKLTILCFLISMVVVNGVLLTSAPLNMAIEEVVYINVLVCIIVMIFSLIGFVKWRGEVSLIEEKVNNDESIIEYDIKGESYYLKIIRTIIELKENEKFNEIGKYKQSLSELNDYITKWVHEIKIPVSVCDLVLERMEENCSSNDTKRLKEQINKIEYYIEQVLYISRASSYEEDITIAQVDLEKLIKKIVRKNSYLFIDKNITLELEDLNYEITTDSKWLGYMIEQLINNSCKYTHENGDIKIYAQDDKNYIHLKILDNGVGIDKKSLDRVFDKGYTGDSGMNLSKATGMGLYIVKKMCNKLNYEISVKSEVGDFTEFTLSINKFSDYLNI